MKLELFRGEIELLLCASIWTAMSKDGRSDDKFVNSKRAKSRDERILVKKSSKFL
jgi:hypothetical protein